MEKGKGGADECGFTVISSGELLIRCTEADYTDSTTPTCSGGVCVAMSCGGGSFTPDGACDSLWDSVKPMTGKYTINYFQCQEDVGCGCMLDDWTSGNDEICADNYNHFRFKLKGKGHSEMWEVYMYGDKTIKVDRDRAEVLSRGVLPSGIGGVSPNLATDHTIYELCLSSERGMGMSMNLADPVSSGMYNGTCVSAAPVAEPTAMSFAAPLTGSTIVVTAAVVTTSAARSWAVAPSRSSVDLAEQEGLQTACIPGACDGNMSNYFMIGDESEV